MGLALGLLAVMAGLLAASETAAQAVREGLALCGGSVIPALFPFLVVSRLFVATGSAAASPKLTWSGKRMSWCAGTRHSSARPPWKVSPTSPPSTRATPSLSGRPGRP